MTDLHDLVDRATATAGWDPDRLVIRAAAAGRRRLRRRRAGAALATCAVLGVVGTGLTLLDQGSGATRAVDPASAGPASATPTPTAAPANRSIAPGPDQTGGLLAQTLRAQGAGDVTDPASWHEQSGEKVFRAGSVLVDGAKVSFLIEREVLKNCGEQPPGAACDSTGDGFEATFNYHEPASGGGTSGIKVTSVSLYTPDHFTVTATAYNAADEKGVPPLRDTPVLGEAALRALVESPAWLE